VCNGSSWYSFGYTGEAFASDGSYTGDNTFSAKVSYPDSGELTIASGAITPTGVFHTIDTEADASSDDLDTISGGVDGQVLILRQEDDARDVTITEAGNIVLPESSSVSLRDTKDTATFIYDGSLSKWVAVSVPMSAVANATETVEGVVELATDAEVTAETETGGTGAKLVATPANMKEHKGVCKAWVKFDGVSESIDASYNVSSITDVGTGMYDVNYTNNMSSAEYAISAVCSVMSGADGGSSDSSNRLYAGFMLISRTTVPTASKCRVVHGNSYYTPIYEPNDVYVTVFGELA
jgi:hypothetical protein